MVRFAIQSLILLRCPCELQDVLIFMVQWSSMSNNTMRFKHQQNRYERFMNLISAASEELTSFSSQEVFQAFASFLSLSMHVVLDTFLMQFC